MEDIVVDIEIVEKCLREKRLIEEASRRWRSVVSIAKTPRRRFRMLADLVKRAEAERKRRMLLEKIQVAILAQKAALHLIAGRYRLSKEVRQAGFGIEPDELASIVPAHDIKSLEFHGGVEGFARKVSVALSDGVASSEIPLRKKIYGSNRYIEKPHRTFWMFVWEALQDCTLFVLMICAVVSIGVGIASERCPKGMYDGLAIMLRIFFVVLVTSVCNYNQYLQFKDLDAAKKNIIVEVTRDNSRKTVSVYDLVVGDIVHLNIGDQVPADGVFISGSSLSIDESSLSGESEPVNVCQDRPFILSGTKVRDGYAKMLVTSVGMSTEWGRSMVTQNEGGEGETPLQVKLNGVAAIIGKIGLAFSVLTFLVLTTQFLVEKTLHKEITDWSSSDALKLLNFFAIAVSIIVVAVPEGLSLAVTLSLAFSMKKLMNDKALVKHLSACGTMGSTTCICTDKTGTLTMNHMVVSKIWICEEAIAINNNDKEDVLKSSISKRALRILLQSIFQNTGSGVVQEKDGEVYILGTPTETALLEFGLLLRGDYYALHQDSKIVRVEPSKSGRKKAPVLVKLPDGGYRAYYNGTSETMVKMCDKIINVNGEPVPLLEEQKKKIVDVINGFAREALRILCIAFKDVEDTSTVDCLLGNDYTLVAVIGMKNPVRPGVKDAIQTCLAAGITVRMLTADNINTAKAIAVECGILTDGLAIEGQDFRNKSLQEMKVLIPKLQVMARSLPSDKYTLVTQLTKSFKEVVAVTGDGINDAPALREANIGLAMGIAGTEVAKEIADVIIMDDNFVTIVNAARCGRAVYTNIQKFVEFQLTAYVVALIMNFVSSCISRSGPLSVVQLLWVNMIMDILGALALATEPPNDWLMKRPPIGRNENFITRTMWRNIIGQIIYQLAILAVLKFDGKRLLNLTGPDATSTLNTFIFNSFVFFQVFKDVEKLNVFRFDCWMFIAITVSTVAFQIIVVEFLGTFAATVPLSWKLWLASILIGAFGLLVSIALKCIPVETIKNATAKEHEL